MFFKRLKRRTEIEYYVINGVNFPIKIHYERRYNSRASVGSKSINIRIPLFMTKFQQRFEIEKLKKWAIDKLNSRVDKSPESLPKKYDHDQTIKIDDHTYTLKIFMKDKKNSSGKLINNNLNLYLSSHISKHDRSNHISTLLGKLLGKERLPLLQKKIKELNELFFQQKINKISFRNQNSRWGSCSSKGNINISTRLILAPEEVLEYVCIHELAHLKEMNHSKRFWALVRQALPDYKEKQKWLKKHGHKCTF